MTVNNNWIDIPAVREKFNQLTANGRKYAYALHPTPDKRGQYCGIIMVEHSPITFLIDRTLGTDCVLAQRFVEDCNRRIHLPPEEVDRIVRSSVALQVL